MTETKRCARCGGQFPRTFAHFGPAKQARDGMYSYCRACKRADTAARYRAAHPVPQPRGPRPGVVRKARVRLVCPTCETAFEVAPHAAARRRFCSYACSTKEPRARRETRICNGCHKPFSFRLATQQPGKFCSSACRKRRRSYTCAYCGEQYERRESTIKWNGGSRWCSAACQAEFWNERSERGKRRCSRAAWRTTRLRIIARDGYRCAVCNASQCTLTVHHIVPWKVSEDDSDENLVTLCRSCHVRIEWQPSYLAEWQLLRAELAGDRQGSGAEGQPSDVHPACNRSEKQDEGEEEHRAVRFSFAQQLGHPNDDVTAEQDRGDCEHSPSRGGD